MMTEGSDVTVGYALPVTTDGVVRLKPRLRERYLSEDVDSAVVQAIGYHLRITVWSSRDNIHVDLPLDGYRAERPYTRSLGSWGVNVNRWTTPGKHADGDTTGWHNDASLDVGYGSESEKPMVEATVRTFEGVQPDL